MSVPHDAIERFDQRVIGAGNVAGATGASAHTGRGFRPWRRSPSDAGPCQGSRWNTRSRPAAGRLGNAMLRAGNARRCARDQQKRGSVVRRAGEQARRKRNDHKSWSEVSVRFVFNHRDFADPKCSHAPFDPEPSFVSPGEGAAGPREGGPAAGSHGEGTRRRGKHLECRLLPMSYLICDTERLRE